MNNYNEGDAKDIESEFLYGLANDDATDYQSRMQSYTETRSAQLTSYKYDRRMAERSSTPKYKTEMYAPENCPLTLKGSLYNDKMFHSMLSKHKNMPSRELSHDNSFIDNKKEKGEKHHLRGSYSKSPIKSAWSNGMVSYKEPRYSRSVRLDLSMMSLDEQLNHTELLYKFHNKDLPMFEVDRLQKQEELM